MLDRGQEIVGVLTQQIEEPERRPTNTRFPASRWRVSSDQLYSGWSALLRSISGRLYLPGDQDSFWVWEIDRSKKLLLISDSSFGRMPISDRMRPRYVRGLRALLAVIDTEKAAQQVVAEDLSEVSGFFERCSRRNQWDWFTVWKLLGFARQQVLRDLRSAVKSLRISLTSGNIRWTKDRDLVIRLASQVPLKEALNSLQESTLPLPNTTMSTNLGTSPEQGRAEIVQMSTDTRRKLEMANAEHRATQDLLTHVLERKGYVVEHNQLIDVYTRLKSGPAIFEIKSITGINERSQCRHALSQLYEYRYLHELPEASLWIVFSHPPENEWIVSYLFDDRSINVLWREGDTLCGPSLSRLDAAIVVGSKSEFE